QDARLPLFAAAGAGFDEVVLEHLAQPLEILAEHGLAAQHDLEAVELGRIVGAGDLNAAVHGQRVGREVERWRGQLADIDRGAAGGDDAAAHGGRERSPRRAVVSPHGEPWRAVPAQAGAAQGGDALPDGVRQLVRGLVTHGAADGVLWESGGGGPPGGPPGGRGAAAAGWGRSGW